MIEFKIISCSALLLGGLILDICMLQLCFLSTYADYLCGFEQNALHHATKHRVAVALKILAPLTAGSKTIDQNRPIHTCAFL